MEDESLCYGSSTVVELCFKIWNSGNAQCMNHRARQYGGRQEAYIDIVRRIGISPSPSPTCIRLLRSVGALDGIWLINIWLVSCRRSTHSGDAANSLLRQCRRPDMSFLQSTGTSSLTRCFSTPSDVLLLLNARTERRVACPPKWEDSWYMLAGISV